MVNDTVMTTKKRKNLVNFLIEFAQRTYEEIAYMTDKAITGEVITVYEAIQEDSERI
jgi:hypothetical protein